MVLKHFQLFFLLIRFLNTSQIDLLWRNLWLSPNKPSIWAIASIESQMNLLNVLIKHLDITLVASTTTAPPSKKGIETLFSITSAFQRQYADLLSKQFSSCRYICTFIFRFILFFSACKTPIRFRLFFSLLCYNNKKSFSSRMLTRWKHRTRRCHFAA